MRQLLPAGTDEDVDPVALYERDDRTPPAGRPWVLVNMVASADGATTLDGRSGGLGSSADRRVFRAIRAVADVILVGAGTVRAEQYGAPGLPEPLQARRIERGQAPLPRVAVVSRSLDLDLASPLFTGEGPVPIVVTSPASSTARRTEVAAARADLLLAGQGPAVDLAAALASLGELGAGIVLAEGGPTLNGQLHDADLVDEWCLSVAPVVAGGDARRLCEGPGTPRPRWLGLHRVLEEDGMLFLRYVRS